MSVKLPQTVSAKSQWADIDLGGNQSLKLLIGRPTFAQQVTVLAAQSTAEFIESRINASVANWQGVVDDAGEPVPFNLPSLQALFATYPQALARVNAAVIDVWITHPEDLEKNLPTPPANGGTETTAETAVSTASSPSTPSSPDEPVPAKSSAP